MNPFGRPSRLRERSARHSQSLLGEPVVGDAALSGKNLIVVHPCHQWRIIVPPWDKGGFREVLEAAVTLAPFLFPPGAVKRVLGAKNDR